MKLLTLLNTFNFFLYSDLRFVTCDIGKSFKNQKVIMKSRKVFLKLPRKGLQF